MPGSRPRTPLPVTLMADRRTGQIHLRVSPAEVAAWRAKAEAADVPLFDLLRQAMARTRTSTAAAAEVERDRTRQIARIDNNLNQIARWANITTRPQVGSRVRVCRPVGASGRVRGRSEVQVCRSMTSSGHP